MFDGFSPRVRLVPVPSPVFGPLLEQIDDLSELKCTLRIIWLLYHKKGYPKFVTLKEIFADRTLVASMPSNESQNQAEVERALNLAVQRGTFANFHIKGNGHVEELYVLNIESDKRALKKSFGLSSFSDRIPNPTPWEAVTEKANIFTLYENNIGMISPMIAEILKEAEDLYPAAWIEEAIKEAVSHNKRNWRYIARILERWEFEGKKDGESRRHTKKNSYY